jgi:DNA-binding winged helix-turn-helix (wHTH) protein
MSSPTKPIFRFGVFEVDTVAGELRKSGIRLRLPEQPFQVLVTLLEHPGEVVTREELRQKLWPADTFVDFDHSLNSIINKLRETLGDSASNARFIETLAKRGYRFLAPVEVVTNHRPADSLSETAGPTPSPQKNSLLTTPEEVPRVPHGHTRILFLLIQVMYLSFYIAALARLSFAEEFLEHVVGSPRIATAILVASAAVGIPVRLYLISAIICDLRDLSRKFLRLFPALFVLDELWALSPFLLVPQIGLGLALAATAALIYVPFSQRTLMLMRDRANQA